jgi:hypothetical protein
MRSHPKAQYLGSLDGRLPGCHAKYESRAATTKRFDHRPRKVSGSAPSSRYPKRHAARWFGFEGVFTSIYRIPLIGALGAAKAVRL